MILSLYPLIRPLLFTQSPQQAHHLAMQALRFADDNALVLAYLRQQHQRIPREAVQVGGVLLPHPLILAAGFVKGGGYASERDALDAVARGDNLLPGWRALPTLVGAVEFGSFTRHPRLGNSGTVMWRDVPTLSTQNRIGLKNPGALAVAEFLARHRAFLPPTFGINLAVTPGVESLQQETDDILASADFFLQRAIRPSWFTLNLSCPNTEDDPNGNQTHHKTEHLTTELVKQLGEIPLWIKVSPNLSAEQYAGIWQACQTGGARAIIATNTQAEPTPDQRTVAGVGGGRLFPSALKAVRTLTQLKQASHASLDVIACGGVLDGRTYDAYAKRGVVAMQYWSAMVYRSPLAAALILNERKQSA